MAVGDVVDGRYRVESTLGSGVSSTVYRARDVQGGGGVALKVLGRGDTAVDIQREAEVLERIRHEHVVRALGRGSHDGAPYLAMELVEGSDLFDILQGFGEHGDVVPLARALDVLTATGDALDAIHAAGFLHRDVKPENVVIEQRTGRPVLVDLGLAVSIGSDTTGRGSGTPLYMAPEQLVGGTLSRATDTYALACTAYHLLALRPPPAPAIPRGVNAAPPSRPPAAPLATLRPELAPLDAELFRSMSPDPARRHPSSGALARALADAVSYAPALRRRDPLRERGVLVVDDDPTFRRAAVRAAELAFGRGTRVEEVTDGHEALREIERRAPSLLLLDFSMPDLDGLALLTAVRRLPAGEDVCVLVVTGTASPRARTHFTLLGVSDVVNKSIGFAGLVAKLSELKQTVQP